jgi:GTPase SAR1 family protein
LTSIPLKIIFIGNSTVGKTCMLISYTSACFPDNYVPKVYDNYVASCYFENKLISLGLWDTDCVMLNVII